MVILVSSLLGAVLMLVLSACGRSMGSGGGTARIAPERLESVLIAIDAPSAMSPADTHPEVTLRDTVLVQHLAATISALPALPDNQACTDERGPHYTLTFRQSITTVATVQANRDGCRPVMVVGHALVRQGTSAFWQELDQAISTATPPLRPDRLAIVVPPHAGQAPQSAQVSSATTARQLYDAILALPPVSAPEGCSAAPVPTYQMVFFAGQQSVPAVVNDPCHTVALHGGYQSRGGDFAMTEQFRSMLQSVLSGVTFAPARPDHLALSVVKGQTASAQEQVRDTQLMLAIYDRIFTLPAVASQPGCPPEADKLAGTGTYATLTFTQWSLPLVEIATYQGSCSFVQLSPTGQWLRASQAFWDLVQRVLAA